MHYGASDKEIVEALALASLVSGTAAFREAIEVLEDQFTVDPVEDEAAR
jgi:alkylhydroperoxidase/carboxymuconolactone decarboxylase family protein YurZ